jgi:hypothetical protein
MDKFFPKKAQLDPLPDSENGRLVAKLLDIEDLNDWETNFTVSVEKQVRAGRMLSLKQRNKIEQILASKR